jgi:N-acetylneuraminate synthase/N,N'-diacetyllegionaminate synthase
MDGKPLTTEIIAEIGQNHNGDMSVAAELIKEAKRAGADVAKFQVYEARALFPPKSQNPWFDYNCATELSRDDVARLADICDEVGIEFMASVFDIERITWLEEVGVRRYKVASRSINDTNLIAAIAATGKPILASLGWWKQADFPVIQASRVDFLYCVAKYPAPLEELKLSSVDFGRYAGFSDHSIGTTAACSAFVRGARILEKHMTLDKSAFGPDHACSMTPQELAAIHSFRTEWGKCR